MKFFPILPGRSENPFARTIFAFRNAAVVFFPLFLFLFSLSATGATPLKGWLLLGPMPVPAENGESPAEGVQKTFFEANQVDPLATSGILAGKGFPFGAGKLTWQPAPESADSQVDLDAFYGSIDFSAAYAYLEISSEAARQIVFGVGSDDAIRFWLNGELIHEYWGGRSLTIDEDLVKATLKPGINRLLVKVQDLAYGWGFAISELASKDYGDRLLRPAALGDIEAVSTLLDLGAEVDYVSKSGLTAWQMARIKGRKEMMALLEKAGADPARPIPAAEQLADYWINARVGAEDAGLVVLIARKGEILYHKAFGLADVANKRPLTTNSSFRIGSITKQFTAVAILMLVKEGKLSLDDKLAKFYPGVANADKISIRQMLNHTSGIRSYTETAEFLENAVAYIQPEKMEATIQGYKPDFEPGENWSYSNSGYYLLGRITEKVSGQSLGQFWEKRIFEPLEMNRSGYYDNRLKIARPDEAIGHSNESGSYLPATDWEMSWAAGAGAISSTTEDLLRWNNAVFSGKIISPELLAEAHSPGRLNNKQVADAMGGAYGFGWMFDDFRGVKTIGHSGGLLGFSSYLTYWPEQDVTIVVLANAMPSNGPDPADCANTLGEFFFFPLLAEQNSYAVAQVDLALLPDYVGRYAYPGGTIMNVRLQDNHLLAQLTGQAEFELFPESTDIFFWRITEAKIAFQRDATGKITGGIHQQSGRSMNVTRMPDEVTVAVDPAILDRYTGTYDLRGSDLVVERRGNQLVIVMANQPEMEIFPRSETEFYLKIVQATVKFETDANGRAVQLLLNQAGMEMEAPRKEP